MFTLSMWWVGMFVEALLLVRGLRTKLVSRYPVFYSYLFVVLAQDVIRYIARQWYSERAYKIVYWPTQFLCLVMGSIVIFEIYRIALEEFPGTARMARDLLRGAFLIILVRALLAFHADSYMWTRAGEVRLERDLRTVQSTGILILVVLFLWYGIPLAKSLGGILLGYTVFVALSVVQLSIVDQYESRALPFWVVAQPVLYTAALGIWTWRLWSADDVPVSSPRRIPRNDYQELASSTRHSLKEARARLGSTVRP